MNPNCKVCRRTQFWYSMPGYLTVRRWLTRLP